MISDDIKNGKFKNIVVFTGAGVSTNAGIPDYRSPTGIFKSVSADYKMMKPEDLFTRSFMNSHPDIKKHPKYVEFLNSLETAKPTITHKMCYWLHTQGYLKRIYTQNVDGLHMKVSDDKDYQDKVVEYHGSFHKDNVVLYGDNISPEVLLTTAEDFTSNDIDLVLVIGSSMQVAPFCVLPNLVNDDCVRVLVDICPENSYKNGYSVYSRFNMCGKNVNAGSLWDPKCDKKWEQYIIKKDCDEWSKLITS